MKLQSILGHLTYLRDNTLVNNADGQSRIAAVLAELDVPTEITSAPVAYPDRRSEERDPGETDQDLKLTSKPKEKLNV